MNYTLHVGDNRDVLKTIPDDSIDSIVTDPPYELGFMGKRWDNTGIAYDVTLWGECLRVLKPGGHIIAFGGTRTYHRMVCAIEDAGFEIRDCIQWIYGSGFPKSRNLDGAWNGWGTALKPANEPAVLARKPLVGTVADNVMAWGVGALNIDGCRIGDDVVGWGGDGRNNKTASHEYGFQNGEPRPTIGRWPANVIFDDEAAAVLDGLSGGASRFFYVAKSGKEEREAGLLYMQVKRAGAMSGKETREDRPTNHPLRANNHPTVKPVELMRYLVRLVTPKGGTVLDPFTGSGSTGCAAMVEQMRFIGIDITPEYIEIARRRIGWYAGEFPTMEGV